VTLNIVKTNNKTAVPSVKAPEAVPVASAETQKAGEHFSSLVVLSKKEQQSAADGQALAPVMNEAQQTLVPLAKGKVAFDKLLKQSFGDQFDEAKADALRQQILKGDFSWAPKVQLLDSKQLSDTSGTHTSGQALGAYSKSENTIYLDREMVKSDSTKTKAVLLEELGHAIDARINTKDAQGDEGAIFAKLASGEGISADKMKALKSENDSGTLNINGKTVEVEYFGRSIRSIDKSYGYGNTRKPRSTRGSTRVSSPAAADYALRQKQTANYMSPVAREHAAKKARPSSQVPFQNTPKTRRNSVAAPAFINNKLFPMPAVPSTENDKTRTSDFFEASMNPLTHVYDPAAPRRPWAVPPASDTTKSIKQQVEIVEKADQAVVSDEGSYAKARDERDELVDIIVGELNEETTAAGVDQRTAEIRELLPESQLYSTLIEQAELEVTLAQAEDELKETDRVAGEELEEAVKDAQKDAVEEAYVEAEDPSGQTIEDVFIEGQGEISVAELNLNVAMSDLEDAEARRDMLERTHEAYLNGDITRDDPRALSEQGLAPGEHALNEDRDGRIVHEVQQGESLNSIASLYYGDNVEFPVSGSKMIAATNPRFSVEGDNPNSLETGDKLVIYTEERSNAMRDLVAAADSDAGDETADITTTVAFTNILLATKNEANPNAHVPLVVEDMRALLPSDNTAQDKITLAEELATTQFITSGRTAEVFDPLEKAAEVDDYQGVEEIANGLFVDLAQVNPDEAIIEDFAETLITYGPQTEAFKKAIETQLETYLHIEPQEASDEVARIYEEEGAEAAMAELRSLTNPQEVDPLQAERIMAGSEEVLTSVANEIDRESLHFSNHQTTFTDMSAAIDSGIRATNISTQGDLVIGEDGEASRGDETIENMPDWFVNVAAKFAEGVSDNPDDPNFRISGMPPQQDPVSYLVENAVADGGGSLFSLEIARQYDLASEKEWFNINNNNAQSIIDGVLTGHEHLEQSVREPVVEYGDKLSLSVNPTEEFNPFLTPEMRSKANQEWLENPPEFVTDAQSRYEDVRQNPVAYDYLRSLQGLAAHSDNKTFSELQGVPVQEKIDLVYQTFDEDPLLQLSVFESEVTANEIARMSTAEVKNDGVELNAISLDTFFADSVDQMAEDPNPWMRGGTYAGIGAVVGSLVYSRNYHNTTYTFDTLGLATEQGIRETVVFAGFAGAFDPLTERVDDPFLKYAVNNGISDGISVATVFAWDKGLGSGKVPIPGLKGEEAAQRFKIGANHKSLIFALPWTITGANEGVLKPLGLMPEPPTGPDGGPQYGGLANYVFKYKAAETLNVAGQVTLGVTASGAYGEGGKALAQRALEEGDDDLIRSLGGRDKAKLIADGKKLAPFNLRGGLSAGQVIRTGWRAAAKSAPTTFALVAANFIVSGSLFDNTISMPGGMNSLQDSGWGKAANAAAFGGPALALAFSSMKFAGPIGFAVGTAGTLAQISFNARDKAEAAAWYEGPTRERLTAAGFDEGFANVMADHDGDGQSVTDGLLALAEYREEDPAQLMLHLEDVYLNDPDGQRVVRQLVTTIHDMERNGEGGYEVNSAKGESSVTTDIYRGGDQAKHEEALALHPDDVEARREHQLWLPTTTRFAKPTSVEGLDLVYKTYFPEVDSVAASTS